MVTDRLVDYRKISVWLVLAASVLLVPLSLGIELDRTLKSAYVTSSSAYKTYQDFFQTFGNDEFVLIAIRNNRRVDDPTFVKSLRRITGELEKLPEVSRVLSLANLKVFQSRKGVLGNYPLLQDDGGPPALPNKDRLDSFKTAMPSIDFLLSRDLKGAGIMIRIHDRWKFDTAMGNILNRISGIVRANLSDGAEFRMVGAPVMREAVQEITVKTTLIFGVLCACIVALVSLYIFKSLRVAAITTAVVGLAVHWIVAMMAILGIPLNSTTALSFGLVLVVSVAVVVHIVTHYYESSQHVEDRVEAVKQALRVIGRPCLMCTLTTSLAFATIMVSSIPMVRQLGFVMSLGVLMSFVLSMVLTPAALVALKPIDNRTHAKMSVDWISWIFRRLGDFVFSHYRLCAYFGILLTAVMLAGTPWIKVDTQVLRLFVDSSDVLANIRFTESNLAPVHRLELVAESEDGAFKDPQIWKRVAELATRLRALPEVATVDSPLPLLRYLHGLLAKPGFDPERLLEDRRLLAQIMSVMTFGTEGKRQLRKYLDPQFGSLHLTVRIKDPLTTPIAQTISKIENVSREVLKDRAKCSITGELVVFSAQAGEVVKSQVLSLVLAFTCITAMMMIQFKSWVLGLLSLIPNLLPMAVIFGVMGWFGIALDNVTVFAATVAIGLSVDDTIHYLTQLKREISAPKTGPPDIEASLATAYRKSAKALISTTSTLFFGFMVLSLTPTQPAIYFGLLGSSAILAALLGDLVFMPAVILTFPVLRGLVTREMETLSMDAGRAERPTGDFMEKRESGT
jgi:uncharacterized protein